MKVFAPRGRVLDLSSPVIMGILNVTPDSFSDGGAFFSMEKALTHAHEMAEHGAKIIDIGGESTRPGSEPVSAKDELSRTIPVIEKLRNALPDVFISIDTTKYDVARAALEAGADIINDISGLQREPRLAELAARYKAGLVVMHSKGEPKTMQNQPEYQNVVREVFDFLLEKSTFAHAEGVEFLIWDYGIGFGKTLDHNLQLLKATRKFVDSGFPLLVGASRKSMIGALLGGRPAQDRISGSVAVHLLAVERGAKVVRVHDVRETADALKIWESLRV